MQTPTTDSLGTTRIPEDSALALTGGLSREYLLHHRVCPVTVADDGGILVAVTDNSILAALDEISIAYDRPVAPTTVAPKELERLIERVANRTDHEVEVRGIDFADDDTAADVRDLANQPPVIRYVNLLIREAHDAAASDIHLEATRGGLSARFRLDGVLTPAPEPPPSLHHAVVSRIKLLAELDIAERRRPQDGRIRVRLESRELDLRVSTVPTMYGESVVLRLLDRGGRPIGLAELGMPEDVRDQMLNLARRPHGMVLVTGPTGSGKTTTLYSALQTRAADAEKIITVEDPIEYQLPGITQVPVHRQVGVTFAFALRAILRQDPDVIMVGEMRDRETAEIAVQSAMTGHLVFSTLHTNDAVSAIPRLLDLGVPDYLVAATVEAVLAQRLVRRVCDDCRAPYTPATEILASVTRTNAEPTTLWHGRGCVSCRGTGYRGRLGVFELMVMNDELKEAVMHHASRTQLRTIAAERGLRSMQTDGWAKIQAGLTTLEEVVRVVQE